MELPSIIWHWEGRATYYTREGCVGCREDRLMANGQPLDDKKKTIAFHNTPLNTFVYIENVANGKGTIAQVTDKGNFNQHGILADLSDAVANEIGFDKTKGIIQVRIRTIK